MILYGRTKCISVSRVFFNVGLGRLEFDLEVMDSLRAFSGLDCCKDRKRTSHTAFIGQVSL